MSKFMTKLFAVALFAGIGLAPVYAQDSVATLRVDRGSVMTSTGDAFSTAQTGSHLVDGERLMIAQGSSVTVIYHNECREQYTTPGVYVINQTFCMQAAASGADCCMPAAARGINWASAGIIAASVGIAAAILANMDNAPGPPASR